MAFIIPFIPWIVTAVLGAGAVVALNEIFKGQSGKIFAVLGESKTGKTTLIRLLSQSVIGLDEYTETVADTMYKGTTIELTDGTRLHVGDLKDLPGDESAWLPWKKRVRESNYVLYMLRSHMLRTGRGSARERSRRDLQQVAIWLSPDPPSGDLVGV